VLSKSYLKYPTFIPAKLIACNIAVAAGPAAGGGEDAGGFVLFEGVGFDVTVPPPFGGAGVIFMTAGVPPSFIVPFTTGGII